MRITLLGFSFLVCFQTAFTQFCPPNLDFETGTFDNWKCSTGSTSVVGYKNTILLNPSVPTPGIHEIISGPTSAKDPFGNFPQLCPYGGKYSIKLGNENTGAEAEGLSYTFQVPPTVDTFSFTYFYAVVFQDPKHLVDEQPRFFVTAFDVATGNLINCASYDYISNGGIPGFRTSAVDSTVLYKEWSPVSIQFAGLANRIVRLEFKTADCTLGGHFGYAYVDVGSSCSNVFATAPYCIETNSIILNAPYGFQSYTWYNQDYSAVIGHQQSLTLSPPPTTSDFFYVDIVPYPGYGCRDTAYAAVIPLPVPDLPVADSNYYLCQFQPAKALTATPLPGSDLLWYTSALGGSGNPVALIPPTSSTGIFEYYVSQKVLFGCEGFRKPITVNVSPTPVASFTINNDKQCEKGNRFLFTSTSTNLDNTTYTWNLGDGETSSSSDSIAHYTYEKYGTYNVNVKVQNESTCFTEKMETVTIFPNPSAAFTYPSLICEKDINVNVQDNSSVPGNVNQINGWWWNVDGNIITSQNPAPLIVNSPGKVPIKLVVTSNQGCISDTNSSNLAIRYRPGAAFGFSKPLCDNEGIRFTNLSTLPQESQPDFIAKWYWKFDSSISSNIEEPRLNFTSGTHHVVLITESNFGCKSLAADSLIEIHPKPQIQLKINDSCILRSIIYQAADPLTTVSKWYWDFGNGLKEGSSQITRSYTTVGYRPITLLGQTTYGCYDTIIRPFAIYDNKAFAGKDTITAMNEPVQLNAHGDPNASYLWSPSNGLNDPTVENPIAILDIDQLYQLDAVTKEGCDSHSKILIKRYKGPDIYIPNAFTPNGDGRNDKLKSFPVGIKAFIYLAVYDRWGGLIFRTTDHYQGWDGTFNGKQMNPGPFVVMAKAIDYNGKVMLRKSTVILIR